MKVRLFACMAIGAATLVSSVTASAATITQCENISRPAGYLTVETAIPHGGCPTRKAIRYRTPENGLVITHPVQLLDVSPAFVVTRANDQFGFTPTYEISQLVDGIVACTMPSITRFDYFTKPAGNIGSCSRTSPNLANAVKYYQHMYVEIARPAGQPGNLRVSLNKNFTGPAINYAIRITSRLHGGTKTVMKTGFTASGSYLLKTLVPEYVADAQAGASFTFDVRLFQASQLISEYSLQATGQEMLKN